MNSNEINTSGSGLKDYSADPDITRRAIDLPFLLLALILLIVGIITMFSASYTVKPNNPTYYLIRQSIFAILGLVLLFIASRFPINFYRKFAFPAYAIALILLVAVMLFGLIGGGSRRWVEIGGVRFQPSELAKVAVVLSFSNYYSNLRNNGKIKEFRSGTLKPLLFLSPFVILLILEPHLSGTIIVVGTIAIMMFCAGVPKKYLLLLAIVGFLAVFFFVFVIGYEKDRVDAMRDPWAYIHETGYQIVQSLYAIGSGGLTGKGFGNSLQKNGYLPESQNDYVFAIICEELGFIGAVAIIVLFILLICRGYWIAIHCTSNYSFLVCVGLTTLFFLQTALNLAVVANAIPSTGISLPFFSYGGTNLLVNLVEVGLILSISRDVPETLPKKRGIRRIKKPE